MSATGKYRLGDRLGTGGMAEVFRATLVGAEGFSRPVAIKHMLASLSAEPEFERMFLNEARLAALLHHPNVVSVLDFDRDADGRLFLVMEMVKGTDLRRLMDTGRLPVPVSIYIISKLLEALAYAHQLQHEGRSLGLVHRDVTPHNLLLSVDGHVKLSDFGIAKAVERTNMTRTGMLKGKVSYMSPEQIEGETLDGRSDLFSAGIVLWELLAGRSLFRGDAASDRVVLNRILIGPIQPPAQVNPDVPEPLSQLCMSMLERERDARPAGAQEALTRLLNTGLVDARGTQDLRDLLLARGQTGELGVAEPTPVARPLPPDRSDTRLVAEPIPNPDTMASQAWSTPTLADDTAHVPAGPPPPGGRTSHFDDLSIVRAPPPSRLGLAAASLALVALVLGGLLWMKTSRPEPGRVLDLDSTADAVTVEALPAPKPEPSHATRPAPEPAASVASEPATATAEPADPEPMPTPRAAARKESRRTASPRHATRVASPQRPNRESAPAPRAAVEPKPAAAAAPPAPKPAVAPAPSDRATAQPARTDPAERLGDDILAPSFLK